MNQLSVESKKSLQGALLAAAGVLLTLFAVEIFLSFSPSILKDVPGNLLEGHFKYLYDFDSRLGWTVKPFASAQKWNLSVRTEDDGIRSNGQTHPSGSAVLALGDSFTFGDEIGDSETWPAQLESMLSNAHVLNAGVSSYGFDQMVLRAETLVPKYRPKVVVAALIDDDFLERPLQSARHGLEKPYFVMEQEKLVLKNVPVPPPSELSENPARKMLAQFKTGQLLLDAADRHWQIRGSFHDYRWVENNQLGATLAGLVDRLLEVNRAHGAKTVFIYLRYEEEAPESDVRTHFFKKLSQTAPDVLFINHAEDVKRISSEEAERFLNHRWLGHWSPEGHHYLAEQIAGKIQSALEASS